MLADVQSSYGLARPFQGAGNFETEHQRVIVREVCAAVQTGRLIVVSGLVGSGKTHLLRRIEDGQIDPSFVITHRAGLEQGPELYRTFRDKQDNCIKVVLRP